MSFPPDEAMQPAGSMVTAVVAVVLALAESPRSVAKKLTVRITVPWSYIKCSGLYLIGFTAFYQFAPYESAKQMNGGTTHIGHEPSSHSVTTSPF